MSIKWAAIVHIPRLKQPNGSAEPLRHKEEHAEMQICCRICRSVSTTDQAKVRAGADTLSSTVEASL